MTKFGICTLNCVAIRFEPRNSSEMISQILFGETFIVIESDKEWFKILTDFDKVEGWVLKNQIQLIDKETHNQIIDSSTYVSNELISFAAVGNNLQTLSIGASFPNFKDSKFYLANKEYHFDGNVNSKKKSKNELVKTAFLFLNTPFLWGGRTPIGIDSSGFTQMVYKINGFSLFREADKQASQGEVLSFIEECEPGDLAFFDNQEDEIVHAGIILPNNYIIHCCEKVRIDRLDHSGIYNEETKRHTHKLRVIKKIF